MSERDYHFFTSSAAHWQTNGSLSECMYLQEKRDKASTYMVPRGYSVYKVLLPNDSKYQIDHYRPELPEDQLIYIDTVVYELTNGKRDSVRVARGKKSLDKS